MKRKGLTLIELVVGIAMIAVLAGLFVVAVQKVRESARVTLCQSRAAQILKAALNYESGMGRLPDQDWQAEIHEYLSLNIQPVAQSQASQHTRFEPFVCPNDMPFEEVDLVTGSYLACAGSWIDEEGKFDGVVAPKRDVHTKVGGILDGLSNTCFVSEGVFPNANSRDRLTKIWRSKTNYEQGELNAFVAEIDSMPLNPETGGWKGSVYPKSLHFKYSELTLGTYIGLGSNMYNHAVEPLLPMVLNDGPHNNSIAPASSTHKTVTVGFCDGHVRQFSGSVERLVWRALGSRNDEEAR